MEEHAQLAGRRHLPSATTAIWVALLAALLTAVSGTGGGSRKPAVTPSLKGSVPSRSQTDGGAPTFAHPAPITNPLLPLSGLTQTVHLGTQGGARIRVEVTRLAEGRTVDWNGRRVATVATQSVTYRDGRVAQVATSFSAQSDAGAVWRFGDDVAGLSGGVVVDHTGTWQAGRDGRPRLVMPSAPLVGDVFRSVGAAGPVAGMATVLATGERVRGPRGPVGGGVQVEARLADGALEDTMFAPGYGEVSSGVPARDAVDRVALAVPPDAVGGAVPEALTAVWNDVVQLLASRSMVWGEVAASVQAITGAWNGYALSQGDGPLDAQMSDRLADLAAAAAARRPDRLRQAALDVAHASLDLQLRHRPPSEVDRDRLRLWARQLQADAAAGDAGSVRGDVVVLDALWSRIGRPADPARAPVDAALADLRAAAGAADLGQAAMIAGLLPSL